MTHLRRSVCHNTQRRVGANKLPCRGAHFSVLRLGATPHGVGLREQTACREERGYCEQVAGWRSGTRSGPARVNGSANAAPLPKSCLRRSAELAGVSTLGEDLEDVVLSERLVNGNLDLHCPRAVNSQTYTHTKQVLWTTGFRARTHGIFFRFHLLDVLAIVVVIENGLELVNVVVITCR
jgi:hypothetical protein